MTAERFRAALERVIEVAPIAEDLIDVVFWNEHEQTSLGQFPDIAIAYRHRQAVIDAVMATHQQAVAA